MLSTDFVDKLPALCKRGFSGAIVLNLPHKGAIFNAVG